MKFSKTAALGCFCAFGLVSQAGALSLTFDQVTFLGALDFAGGGKNKEEKDINRLARLAPNSATKLGGGNPTSILAMHLIPCQPPSS